MSGVVYLIHAAQGIHCTGNRYTQHYLGWTSDMTMLHSRLAHHRAGSGARLMAAFNDAQIDWRLVRIWRDADRYFERALKKRRNHPRLCPVCAAERGHAFDTVWPPEHPPRINRDELQVIREGLRWHRGRMDRVAQLAELFAA